MDEGRPVGPTQAPVTGHWATRHRGGVVALAAAALALAALMGWRAMQPAAPQGIPARAGAYFFDLGSSKLFVADAAVVPPIAAPSGHTRPDGSPGGVRAYVFACGDCALPGDRLIGHLETYTPAGKSAADEFDPDLDPKPLIEGSISEKHEFVWVAAPDRPNAFVPAASDEGQRIVAQASTLCGAVVATPCLPSSTAD